MKSKSLIAFIHYSVSYLRKIRGVQGLCLSLCFVVLGVLAPRIWALGHGDHAKGCTPHYRSEGCMLSKHNLPVLAHNERSTSILCYRPLPTKSITTPSEFERQKEDENFDHGECILHTLPHRACHLFSTSSNVNLAQIEREQMKRTKVSLVILHHAWKHFLA